MEQFGNFRIFGGQFSAYSQKSYLKRITTTTREMIEEPGKVTERALGQLMRGMGLQDYFFPYDDIQRKISKY